MRPFCLQRTLIPIKGMNMSLPATLLHRIEWRVTGGGYGSVSEYVRQLVCHDRTGTTGIGSATHRVHRIGSGGLASRR